MRRIAALMIVLAFVTPAVADEQCEKAIYAQTLAMRVASSWFDRTSEELFGANWSDDDLNIWENCPQTIKLMRGYAERLDKMLTAEDAAREACTDSQGNWIGSIDRRATDGDSMLERAQNYVKICERHETTKR